MHSGRAPPSSHLSAAASTPPLSRLVLLVLHACVILLAGAILKSCCVFVSVILRRLPQARLNYSTSISGQTRGYVGGDRRQRDTTSTDRLQGATVTAAAFATVAFRDELGVMSGSVLYTHTDSDV